MAVLHRFYCLSFENKKILGLQVNEIMVNLDLSGSEDDVVYRCFLSTALVAFLLGKGEFVERHYGKHFSEINLNLIRPVVQEIFIFCSSVGPFVQQSRTICTIW